MKIESSSFCTNSAACWARRPCAGGWARSTTRSPTDDPAVDPVFPECRGQKIYIFWHEYILFPLYLRGHCNLAMLLSRHRDAEILSHMAASLGFEFVRGSTNRGGVAALRETAGQEPHDAPDDHARRPARPAAATGPGLRLLWPRNSGCRWWRWASATIVPGGCDSAWDQFAIPRPYSPARAVTSGEIFVPPDLDRDGLEHFRQKIERLLNRLTAEAEAWAELGHAHDPAK